jgi:hypothetical protein
VSQYGEPLFIERDRDGFDWAYTQDRKAVVRVGVGNDIALRAVACVNALAGVAVPEKLPEVLAALLALFAAEDKYDALDKMRAPMDEILDGTARISAAGARVRSAYKAMMGETT